jgi:hypothetical protein
LLSIRSLSPACILLSAVAASAQTPQMPPNYAGVRTFIPGIFITPVPNAPFSATVDIVSHQKLPDGTTSIRTTINHIARDSSGRIYNERRMLVPNTFKGDPILLETHIYDPNTRLNVFINPHTHLARETVLPQPLRPAANSLPPRTHPNDPSVTESDLGTQLIGTVELKGIRKTRTIPASASNTGQPVVVDDEYWYSPDLSVYMIIKHDDPRTGEQIVAVSKVERSEPPASLFAIPADCKVVDETPPPPQPRQP